ncbi:ion channel [Desulfoscipio gibsoniae]|uniref:ion channel n=1 Tax=Desulfoscipio gibsoniae TaxID=102134 RepID=UPI000232A7E1|nr:ion channel [Desulfoscipio gibsoniae]
MDYQKTLWKTVVLAILIPLLYSFIYIAFVYFDTDSFKGLCPESPYFDYVYFSYITFTTTGYGDIYPISILAKIIVLSEIILGITFIALIIFLNFRRISKRQ